MKQAVAAPLVGVALLAVVGCQTPPRAELRPYRPKPEETAVVRVQTPVSQPPQARVKRQWTDRQIEMLRNFALQESPTLWQTVQALKSESAARKVELRKLRDDLALFGRDPDQDADCQSLKTACEELDESVMVVYTKLEDAYLSYKKFQATPGKKEYGDLMRKALEDGIQEADAASAKYKNLSQTK